MLSLKQALRFSFSTFVLYLSFWALLVSFVLQIGDAVAIRLRTTIPDISGLLYCFVYLLAFVRLSIVAQKTVFNINYPFSCSMPFFLKKSGIIIFGICLPIFACCFLAAIYTQINPLLLCIIPIILIVTAYLQDWRLKSIPSNIRLIIRHPGNFLLLIIYSVSCSIAMFYIAEYVATCSSKFMRGAGTLLFPSLGLIVFFVSLGLGVVMKIIYNFLPKKLRILLLTSVLFVIPSLIIYWTMGLPLNLLMFLVLAQIFWYVVLFSWFLIFSSLAILTHLMAQVAYNSCPHREIPVVQNIPRVTSETVVEIGTNVDIPPSSDTEVNPEQPL